MALSGDRLQRILNSYDSAVQGAEDATIERIFTALDNAAREFEQQLTKSYAKNQTIPGLLPNQRALLIRQEIAEYMALLKPEQREEIEREFEQLLSQSSASGIDLSQELINATTNTNVAAFATVNLEAVRFQAQDAAKRLYRWSDEYQQKISGIVEMHLAIGSGPQKVASALRNELGIVKGRAEAIARTESMSAMDSATRENYKRNEIQYVQRVATLDSRVCGICAARAGKVYRLEEAPSVLHVRDRCSNVPWRPEWAALGLIDNAWMEQHAKDVQSQALARGEKLNDGPAPFERTNGLQSPKAVWSPGDPLPTLPTKSTPAPKAATPKKPKSPPAFPKSLDVLEEVRRLGGSTGAVLVRNPKTGQQYVMKKGASPEHLKEEMLADSAYQALGVKVPKYKEYTDADGNPVKLAEYIEGKPLGDLTGQAFEAARRKLQQNFAADALLGNWDVVGMDLDNVLVDASGEVWRIDNGGSLRYRAMGAPKGDRWNQYPTEVYTLKDSKVNQQTAQIFGDLSHDETISQIEAIAKQRDKLLKALPKELKASVSDRLTELERMASINRSLEADKFNQQYRERFTRHSLGIRAEGIVDKMPTRFDLASDNQVYDENGELFDNLRGDNSLVNDISDYIAKNNGDYRSIGMWMQAQGGSSWSNPSQAVKATIAEARNNWDDYFWLKGQDKAKEQLRIIRQAGDNWDETFTAFHAFNYELMSRVEMPNNDLKRGVMRVYRTEDKDILDMNGVKEGKGQIMPRGAAESSSAFTPISAVAGAEVTIQEVPHHRILGTYFQSRYPDSDEDAFLGDMENEIVFIPEGIDFEYVGELGEGAEKYAAKPNYKPKNSQGSGKSAKLNPAISLLGDDGLLKIFGTTDLSVFSTNELNKTLDQYLKSPSNHTPPKPKASNPNTSNAGAKLGQMEDDDDLTELLEWLMEP